MNLQMTEEQLRVQALARKFAEERIMPIAREIDEKRYFPWHIAREMGELGFLAGPIPPKYGGKGLDYISFANVYEEIGRACSSVRGFLAVHAGLCSLCIYDWGSEEQKMEFLPKLATGEYIGCYALTEPNAGTDVANMETTVTRDGDYYVINGTKHWITNGNRADVALVFGTLDRSLKHKAICAFIVRTDTTGFERQRMEGVELGHRASDHARMVFRDLRVHRRYLLGKEGEGFKVAMGALDHGRLGVAAGAVGVAQACVDACVEFARKRVQFGQRIGEFQLVQEQIADMVAETDAARLLVWRAADQKMRGIKNTKETSIAKYYATEAAARAANNAVILHGSYGYSNRYPVERYFRDIKGLQIYEGTNLIQKIIIARAALKEADELEAAKPPS
ncbi:MAG: acyl-CoA dehydrogenase family protein [Chloroflexi bacterium]|nr:acyl-CoA dehydrogenase family protein [Chloroflexota bacterium]